MRSLRAQTLFSATSDRAVRFNEGSCTMIIDTVAQLRALYPAPRERALKKQMTELDAHCMRFIDLSPFMVVASVGASGVLDSSPRGGAPGFVRAVDARTLLVPDAPGNNRLDTLENVIDTGKVGMLFFIPGVDETLRINGAARLSCSPQQLQAFAGERRIPRLCVEVTVAEAYLHCAKALMRSKLWQPSAQVPRSVLPTMGQMINVQSGTTCAPETQEEMLRRYEPDL